MQPQSLAHHQLDSLPRQRDRLWLLPCAGHLWPAAQRAPYMRRQVKSGYVSPPLGTHRQHIQSTVAGEGKGQQGGGGGVLASAGSVENNRLQMRCVWETMAWFTRYLSILRSLSRPSPSFLLSVLPPCNAEIKFELKHHDPGDFEQNNGFLD